MAGKVEEEGGNVSQNRSSFPRLPFAMAELQFLTLQIKVPVEHSSTKMQRFKHYPHPAWLHCSLCLERASYQSNHESSLAITSHFKRKPEMQNVTQSVKSEAVRQQHLNSFSAPSPNSCYLQALLQTKSKPLGIMSKDIIEEHVHMCTGLRDPALQTGQSTAFLVWLPFVATNF